MMGELDFRDLESTTASPVLSLGLPFSLLSFLFHHRARSSDIVTIQHCVILTSKLCLGAMRLITWRASYVPGNPIGQVLAAICIDSYSLNSPGFLGDLPRDSAGDLSAAW